MRRSNKILLIILCAFIGFFGAMAIGFSLFKHKAVEYDFSADMDSVMRNRRLVRVAGDADFAPFSYLDENGLPCGHNVELIMELGRRLGFHVDLTLCDHDEMLKGFNVGRYDVLLAMEYSASRNRNMGFSSPVISDSYVLFGPPKAGVSEDIGSLSNLRIAVRHNSVEMESIIVPMGLKKNAVEYDSLDEAFDAVLRGECDVVLSGCFAGKSVIERGDYPFTVLSSRLYETVYYLVYNKNNSALGKEINLELDAMLHDGYLSKLNNKWTQRYETDLSLIHYISRSSESILAFIFIIVAAVLLSVTVVLAIGRREERRLLTTNHITGLPTTATFCKKVKDIVNANPAQKFAVVQIDIDNFKEFNGLYTHNGGDRLLEYIGKQLSTGSLPTKIKIYCVGYGGADHFILLMKQDDVRKSPKRIYDALLYIFKAFVQDYDFSLRLGFCEIVQDTTEDIITYCDRAMQALRSTKGNYENHWAWFDEKLRRLISEEAEIVNTMHDALEKGQFIPYFQPQFDFSSGKIIGAETLVRWQHPTKGLIPPGQFIPVFEKNGFIYEMDKVIWRKSIEILKKWRSSGITLDHISINISRADLYHSDLAETLLCYLNEFGLSTRDIHLEITESAYMQSPELLSQMLDKLHKSKFFIEMDDFGSGYSSLTVLKKLPFDMVKLDMGFIEEEANDNEKAGIILSSAIHLVQLVGLPLIAEGVEQPGQAEFLKSVGCTLMQGYLFSKPLSPDELEHYLLDGLFAVSPSFESINPENNGSALKFLDYRTQDSMLFNSYVGGAAVIEYRLGKVLLLRCNDSYFTEVGTTREAITPQIQNNILSAMPEESGRTFVEMLEKAMADGEAECEVFASALSEGKEIWCKNKVRLLSSKGDSHFFYLSVSSTTYKKQLERRNVELYNDLYTVVDNMTSGVARFEKHGDTVRCKYMNLSYHNMFGYSEEEMMELVTARLEDFVHPDDLAPVLGSIDRIWLSEEDSDIVFRGRHRDGSYITLDSKAVYDKRNKNVYCFVTDVTEFEKAKKELGKKCIYLSSKGADTDA